MFGIHVNRYHSKSSTAKIVDHIKAAQAEAQSNNFTMSAIQIFISGPRARDICVTEDEILELKTFIENNRSIRVFAHSAYCANPWKGNNDAIEFINKELEVCFQCGIEGLIIHLPKSKIDVVTKYLPKLSTNVTIYLETPANVPSESYYESPEKLYTLCSELIKTGVKNIGICIDTAHIWTSGVDISDVPCMKAYIEGIQKLSLLVPVMFHLNDSKRELGTGPDSHEGLTRGKIWSSSKDSLYALLHYIVHSKSAVILERKPKEELLLDYKIINEFLNSL